MPGHTAFQAANDHHCPRDCPPNLNFKTVQFNYVLFLDYV